MITGNLLKEKKEYIIERFTTKEGLVELFIGTFIWSFVVVKYTYIILTKIREIIAFKGFIGDYLTYLVFGVIMTLIGWAISWAVITLSKKLKIVK